MKTYLAEFFDLFDYPMEAREQLLAAYDMVNLHEELRKEFDLLLSTYAADKDCNFRPLFARMSEISQAAGVNVYTGALLLSICFTKQLKKFYEAEKISDQIWFTSMCDLKWKLLECKDVHNVWGTFVAGWFAGFFHVSRFGLGRLQFEPLSLDREYTKGNVTLKEGDMVINVHIPRTGTRLDRKSVLESYKEAAQFFQERYQLDKVAFVCHSWLLYPRNKEVLSPQSNLYSFMSDFEIIESGENADYEEAWRLFDKKFEGDVDQLPQNSSLRRAYADWIRKGEKIGWGYGIFLYEELSGVMK